MKKNILIMDKLYELEGTNALLGFMQTAFAEGDGLINNKEAATALYHIYTTQIKTIEELKQMVEGSVIA